jgi:WD40 repeat protein
MQLRILRNSKTKKSVSALGETRELIHTIAFIVSVIFLLSACVAPRSAKVTHHAAERNATIARIKTPEGTISLVPASGHSQRVNSIKFTRDFTRVLTASDDWLAYQWDISTGNVVTRFVGHNGPVKSAVYSPDERFVVTAGHDRTLRLWNANSGSELRAFSIDPPKAARLDPVVRSKGIDFHALVFSPDGRSIVAGTDMGVWIIDLETGTQTELLPAFGRLWTDFRAVDYSKDGRWILGGYWAGVCIWDARTFEPYRKLQIAGDFKQSFTGIFEDVSAASFSPSAKLIATGSKDGLIRVWSVDSEEVLWQKKNQGGAVTSVAFGENGIILLSSHQEGLIRLWNVDEGIVKREAKPRLADIYAAAFAAGDQAIGIAQFKSAQILGISDLKPIQYFLAVTPSNLSGALAVSSDRRLLAYGTVSGNLSILDLTRGFVIKTYDGIFDSWVSSLSFSPDSQILMAGSGQGELASFFVDTGEGALKNLKTGERVRKIKYATEPIESIAYSPADGRFVALSTDNKIVVWDTRSDASPVTLKGWGLTARDSVYGAGFSQDGKLLIGHFLDEAGIRLWDVGTWDLRSTVDGGPLPVHSGAIKTAAVSSDNRLVLSGGSDKIMRLWKMGSSTPIRTYEHPGNILYVAFVDDDTSAVSVTDQAIYLWELETQDLKSKLSGHDGGITGASLLHDGRHLVTSGGDDTIRIWNIPNREQLVVYAATYFDEWLTFAPNGFFDAPIGGLDQFMWRIRSSDGTQTMVPVESFQNEFYYDGLMPDLLAGKRPTPPRDIANIDRRLPKVELEIPDLKDASNIEQRYVPVEIRVTPAPSDAKWDANSGVRDVRLFRNGRLVMSWPGDALQGKESRTLRTEIALVQGDNTVTAYAFNRHNVKSTDAKLFLKSRKGPSMPPRLHVLAVGVDDYGFPNENLTLSVADARDFAGSIADYLRPGGPFAPGHITALTDSDAIEDKVLGTLKSWGERAAGRNASSASHPEAPIQPEDVLVIFFSGHGVATRDDFYFLTADIGVPPSTLQSVSDTDSRLKSAISTKDLEAALRNIDASQILLILDACYSGQALQSDDQRRGQLNTQGLAQLAFEKGISVLTAAQSYQTARAAAYLGHGYLTHATLIEGLGDGRADRSPSDRRITSMELFAYAIDRVPQLVQEMQDKRQKIGLQRQQLLTGSGFVPQSKTLVETRADYQRPRAYSPRYFYRSPTALFQLRDKDQ